MKWWGWLVAGVAASLVLIAGLVVLDGLGVLKLGSVTDINFVVIGGLVIIWSVCIAVPLVLKAIKTAKAAKGDK